MKWAYIRLVLVRGRCHDVLYIYVIHDAIHYIYTLYIPYINIPTKPSYALSVPEYIRLFYMPSSSPKIYIQ